MPLPLEPVSEKVILLTGANRGIGLATANELADRGATVIAGVRRPEQAPRMPESVQVVELDTGDAESCRAFIHDAMVTFGRIDGLINNAAIFLDRDISTVELKEDDFRHVLDVNLIGPWRLCKFAVPEMVKRGYGRVVNVSSGLGSITEMGGGYPSYRMTKLALNGLTRVLSADVGRESNVKINSICPGWVRTEMGGSDARRDPSEPAREIADLVSISAAGPSGGFFRYGEPAEW